MTSFEEGHSIMCLPLFKREAYFQWRNNMKYFIRGFNFDICMIIEDGHLEASKKKKKMSVKDTKKDQLNAKAMHILLCALDEEISKFSHFKCDKKFGRSLKIFMGKKRRKMKFYQVLISSHRQMWIILWLMKNLRKEKKYRIRRVWVPKRTRDNETTVN
ncbi:hypothetical protein GQ457_05G015840 [Hibiscus cannabinus]